MDDTPNPKAVEFVQAVRRSMWANRMDDATLETRFEGGGVWIGWPGLTDVKASVRLTRLELETVSIPAAAEEAVRGFMSGG